LAGEERVKAGSLDPLATQVLFHAAREAMHKASRHGRAVATDRPLHVRVEMAWREHGGASRPGLLEIMIQDDGVGLFKGTLPVAGGGRGLGSTMIAIIGGTLAVEGEQGACTRVLLTLQMG
jgi:glucose-6-phosphate-specific signal transduction histidine kinase